MYRYTAIPSRGNTEVGTRNHALRSKQRRKAASRLKKTSVSVDEELWRQFGSKLRLHGLEISQVLGELVRSYLSGEQAERDAQREDETRKHAAETAVTPQNDHERYLVAGLLLLFRDKREIAQGVKEIVAGLLSTWINKAKAAIPDLNGGKRSA